MLLRTRPFPTSIYSLSFSLLLYILAFTHTFSTSSKGKFFISEETDTRKRKSLPSTFVALDGFILKTTSSAHSDDFHVYLRLRMSGDDEWNIVRKRRKELWIIFHENYITKSSLHGIMWWWWWWRCRKWLQKNSEKRGKISSRKNIQTW